MRKHVEFHFSQLQLLKCLHNREFDLHYEKLALHLFVPVVLQRVQICFQLLLQLVLSNLGITIFKLRCQLHHLGVHGGRLFLFLIF